MFAYLFAKKGNGTAICPKCGGVITPGQYIHPIGKIEYHHFCGTKEEVRLKLERKETHYADKTRNEYGFPILPQK